MNFKLMPIAISIALSAAVAQESSETTAAPAEETAVAESTKNEVPAPEATASEPQAAASSEATAVEASKVEATVAEATAEQALDAVSDTAKANFDILRGRAYNFYTANQAAAYTIADKIAKPHEMAGSKLVYLEPSLDYAALAFGDNSTYFVSLQNKYDLGLLTAGYANKSFGAEVYAAIGKTWRLTDGSNRDSSTATVNAGDLIGAVYSMPLGNLDLTVNAYWLTTTTERSTEEDISSTKVHNEREQDYWDINLTGTVSNTPAAEKKFSWSAGAQLLRHNRTETVVDDDDETTRATLDSRWEVSPFFNFGLPILSTNNARVLIGTNTNITFQIYDDIATKVTETRKDHIAMGIYTSPNILAELALSDNWLVFGGASYLWKVFATEYLYESRSDILGFGMESGKVAVNAGARFQYKNFALEAAINDVIFNNPLAGFNNNAIIARLGGFIHF